MTLAELKKGDVITGIEALVEKRTVGTAKNGKAFANVVLRDKSGSFNCKVWSFTGPVEGVIVEGAVIYASGTVEEYQGNLQIIIHEANTSLSDPVKFQKSTEFDIEEMWGDLVKIVNSMEEPLTKFVAEELLLHPAVSEKFKKAPAAKKLHNAWVGGLLEHAHSMCLIADPLIKHYQTRYFQKLSRDKILFGIILHDMGKITEYDSKPPFNKTAQGILVDHIVMGPAWVFETANKFKNRDSRFQIERAQLMHILASHHGTNEWGSPVVPSTLEAILVHQLDLVDSRMLHAIEKVRGKQGNVPGFSEWSEIARTNFYQYN